MYNLTKKKCKIYSINYFFFIYIILKICNIKIDFIIKKNLFKG